MLTKDRIEARIGIIVTIAISNARASLHLTQQHVRMHRQKLHLRKTADSSQLPFSQGVDLMGVKALPCIELDQPDSLQDFRGEPDTLVRQYNTILAVHKHHLHEQQLQGETEKEDAKSD